MKKNGTYARYLRLDARQPVLPPALYTGWSNYRCATRLELEETATGYRLTTTLYGMNPDTLKVTIEGAYLIVEGQVKKAPGGRYTYGRYARHLPLQQPVDATPLEVIYGEDGLLQVYLLKLLPG
ncbi:MAG: Hsp20/alpha crystallin family protein [Anaerolineae bacterium]|nr:Hsp20/alpha crystallin family protein [Anaerolineae bacterium]